MHWRGYVVILLALAALMACSPENEESRDDATTTSSSTLTTGPGGGADGGQPPPGSEAYLALTCEDDSACGPGGICLRPTDDAPLRGGPAGGYCSRPCSEDAECPGLYSLCIKDDVTGEGACFLGCELGPPLLFADDELDSGKCRGREDVRCGAARKWSVQSFVCLPTCGRDEQCPADHMCDPRSRVCVTTPSTGLPMGANCDLDHSCAGTCLIDDTGLSVCTSWCVKGGPLIGTDDCGGSDSGLCSLDHWDGAGAGDEGMCVPACDEQDDCAHPYFWCRNVVGPGYPGPGYCSMLVAPCPSGTCASGTCTETIYGPLCLESKYPLGSAAP
jgi:hypothetical protein